MTHETVATEDGVQAQVSGAFLLGLTQSLLNLVEFIDEDIPFTLETLAPTDWYPYEFLTKTVEAIRVRKVPSEILFRAGVNFFRIWYHQGPGRTMVRSGLDWLNANQRSGGYNSVVRGGARHQIGWCDLLRMDRDAGLAVYEDMTAIPPEYVRGLFYEGCLLFDDMEYVQVDVAPEPCPDNPAFTKKIVTVRFRLVSAATPNLDARIDALRPGEKLDLSPDEIESLVWRHKSLRRRRSHELAYHDQIGVRLAEAISQSRRARDELSEAKARIEAAASAGIIGVWEWDITSGSLIWDTVMYRLYGLDPSQFGGTFHAWRKALHPEDRPRIDEEIAAAVRGERPFAPEFRVIWPDGSVHYIKVKSQTCFDEHGAPTRMIGVNYDQTEQKLIQSELDKLAYYDRLTNLPNRRLFEDQLERSLVHASRHERKLALLFIDLDRFKPINDQYGHQTGDWVLQRVAERISGLVRDADMVARIGGDEFLILLPDVGDRDGADFVAERIASAFERPFVTNDDKTLTVSASVGMSLFPDDGRSASDLIRFADVSMYRSKKSMQRGAA